MRTLNRGVGLALAAAVTIAALVALGVSASLLPEAALAPAEALARSVARVGHYRLTEEGREALALLGGLLAVAGALLLWLEVRPAPPARDSIEVLREPGLRVEVTGRAVRALAVRAAVEEGAREAAAELRGAPGGRYDVRCTVTAPSIESLAGFGAAVREGVRRELRAQRVPFRALEVRVHDIAEETMQQEGSAPERSR